MESHPQFANYTKPFLAGLAGGSASGKSTFARALVSALNDASSNWQPTITIEVFSTDAYFLSHDRIPTIFSPTLGRNLPDYNRPDSLDAAAFSHDLDARCARPDAPDVLIIEGLMILHLKEIRERCDLGLFVELDADQRALRRMVRNLGTRNDPLGEINNAGGIASYFLESAKVGHELYVEPSRKFADFILRGDGDFGRISRLVAGMILSQIRSAGRTDLG